jgi:SIR2-like domain
MRDTTVIIFGAGATKDCGGPLTNEILPEALASNVTRTLQQDALALVQQFLNENFPVLAQRQRPQDYPSLPLFLSLLDTAIDRKQPFSSGWPPERVAEVRQAVEAAVFAVLDFRSPQEEVGSYLRLLQLAYPGPQPEATVISLNYDMILDIAMFELCQERKPDSVPSYGCDIKTEGYQSKERWGRLLKIHGSVNWMYCSQCHHLEIGWSSKRSAPSRIGHFFFRSLDDQYAHRSQCPECGTPLRPILITPTHRKDYRNPHLARIWYEAERALQRANRVFFVGYSLPDDDVEVIYLLKRGLGTPMGTPSASALPSKQITVIEKDDKHQPLDVHPVGQRYRALFGDDIDFRTEGFSAWLSACPIQSGGLNPGPPGPPLRQ